MSSNSTGENSSPLRRLVVRKSEETQNVVVKVLHRVLLWILQTYRRVKLWLAMRMAHLRWFYTYRLDDKPLDLKKKPELPAIASESDSDLAFFILYCLRLGIDSVIVYKPTTLVLNSFVDLLKSLGFRVEQYSFGIIPKIELSYEHLKMTVEVLSDRESYVSAIQERSIGPATETAALGAILGHRKVDFLLLAGLDTVGEFPPLVLRACELYFASTPLREVDLDIAFLKFARTEQRKGV